MASKKLLSAIVILLAVASALPASTLWVGFNTLTPVQLYNSNGTYTQDWGPAGAIAAFPNGTGDYFSLVPSASSSTITEYNSSSSPIGSFTLNNIITDGGSGAGSLLFSAFDGTVYRVSTTGTILNSWSTGFSHVGVTSNGTDIYTTEGDGGNLIDIWSTAGASLGHIATPFTGLYGLGYDASTGDFWAGTTNFVYELSSSGSLLATLNLTGDSRTPNGAVHDGLEVGNLIPTPPVTIPEPSSILLIAGGMLMLILWRFRSATKVLRQLGICAIGLAATCFGSVNVTLTPSVGSGAPVGTTILWTAKATDSTNASATFTYQFSVGPSGQALQVVRDFYTYNNFPWTPSQSEGIYNFQVVVRSSTGATGTARDVFSVSSRATGSTPVVSRTNHPLVALYSMPPCPAGQTARVRFKMPSDTLWQATSTKTCNGHTSLNFYVAGMRASTNYQLQHDLFNGPFNTPGPVLTFATGGVPSSVPIVPYSVVKAPQAPNNTAYPVLLFGPLNSIPYATDSSGHLIWFLPPQSVEVGYLVRPLPGGTFFVITFDNSSIHDYHLLREYDLAGNLIRETNYAVIAQQLKAWGTDPITSIHHEAIKLPNGNIAFFGSVEKVANQGSGPVDVLGDELVVVNPNLQVVHWWNEFQHLDVSRPAVLGEVCKRGQQGCPYLMNPNYSVANDWTHSNAIAYTSDNNMLVSSRHQDWVIKFNYSGGPGNGNVIWRLGRDGDFRTTASDAFPWFSHQHNIEIEPNGNLSLFDNGNTRVAELGGGNSRGQAWQVNESTRVATRVINIDLGQYSMATGTTQLLSNGNYAFDLGFAGAISKMKEFTPSGTLEAEQDANKTSYRSFRMRSLYSEY
jgi:arylsulfate sulfotransferase